jgi:hypothetical protein
MARLRPAANVEILCVKHAWKNMSDHVAAKIFVAYSFTVQKKLEISDRLLLACGLL